MTRLPLLLATTMLAGSFVLPALAQTAPAAATATTPPVVTAPAAAPAPTPPAATPAPTTVDPVTEAKPDDGAASDARRRARAADAQAMFEAHLAALHAGLTLTPEQERMWPAVEQGIRGVRSMRLKLGDEKSDRRQDAQEDDHEREPMAALKVYSEHLLLRGQALKALADAAEPLYATLSPEQKARLPVLMRDMNPRRDPVARMVDDMEDDTGPDHGPAHGMSSGPGPRDDGPRGNRDHGRDQAADNDEWDRREEWDHRGDRDMHEDRRMREPKGWHHRDRAEMDGGDRHEDDMRRSDTRGDQHRDLRDSQDDSED